MLLISLAVGKADQLELHSPRRQKIDPSLTLTRPFRSNGSLAKKSYILAPKITLRRVEVIYIKRKVVAADIAVSRRRRFLAVNFVLENLEIRTKPAPEKTNVPDNGAGGNVEMALHPVSLFVNELAKVVNRLATKNIDKESGRFFEVGHGEAHMLHAPQSGQPIRFIIDLIRHRATIHIVSNHMGIHKKIQTIASFCDAK